MFDPIFIFIVFVLVLFVMEPTKISISRFPFAPTVFARIVKVKNVVSTIVPVIAVLATLLTYSFCTPVAAVMSVSSAIVPLLFGAVIVWFAVSVAGTIVLVKLPDRSAALIEFTLPPEKRFPPTPSPPKQTIAPVVVEVDAVVLEALTVVAATVFGVIDPIAAGDPKSVGLLIGIIRHLPQSISCLTLIP